jgi:predicted porin
MKKWMVLLSLLFLAAPAMGADWEFYGSQRMATFWNSFDFGDATVNGEDDDAGLTWDFQGNSRLGAKVKAGKVIGQIELGLKGTNGGDIDVGTRRAYGTWKFSENGALTVGKDYSPITQFTSGQVIDEDLGLAGIGTNDGFRPGQIRLELGDFQIAAITSFDGQTLGGAGSDPDKVLPKFEASYAGKIGSFTFTPAAGFQYLKEGSGISTALTDDIDIISYILGLELGYEIGAFYIKAAGGWGQNWSNANWNSDGFTSNLNAGAALNAAGDDTEDCMSWQAALILGYNVSETLVIEAGAGYRSDDNDAASNEDEAWSAYLQAVITLAPGVYIVPEVGYFDFMDDNGDNDEGSRWYAGAKWQIDF